MERRSVRASPGARHDLAARRFPSSATPSRCTGGRPRTGTGPSLRERPPLREGGGSGLSVPDSASASGLAKTSGRPVHGTLKDLPRQLRAASRRAPPGGTGRPRHRSHVTDSHTTFVGRGESTRLLTRPTVRASAVGCPDGLRPQDATACGHRKAASPAVPGQGTPPRAATGRMEGAPRERRTPRRMVWVLATLGQRDFIELPESRISGGSR